MLQLRKGGEYMKIIVLAVLVVLGLYWLVVHSDPLPFNHDSFGLYDHTMHRTLGVILLAAAGGVGYAWKDKKK